MISFAVPWLKPRAIEIFSGLTLRARNTEVSERSGFIELKLLTKTDALARIGAKILVWGCSPHKIGADSRK